MLIHKPDSIADKKEQKDAQQELIFALTEMVLNLQYQFDLQTIEGQSGLLV